MFKSLLKAAVGTVLLPVEIVVDVVTLGGDMTDKDKPYTVEALERIRDNIDEALE